MIVHDAKPKVKIKRNARLSANSMGEIEFNDDEFEDD